MTQPPYPPGPPQPPYQPGPQQPYQPGPQQPYQQPYQPGPQQPYGPGPQQPYQAQFAGQVPPQKKKGKGCLIAAIIVAVVLVAGVVGVIAVINAVSRGVSNATTAEHTFTFKIETTAKATVVYGTTAGTSQEVVTTSWSKDKKVNGLDVGTIFASLDPDAPDTATISCEILVDGKSQSKNSGTGKDATASCSAATIK